MVVVGGLLVTLVGAGFLIMGLQPSFSGGAANGPDTALGALMLLIGLFLASVGVAV